MSFRVKTESFEGPFDLLLYLVSRQKVDIGVVSITEITDQYLEEISHMEILDLDVASDFLLVASTLLEIKAASLIPTPKDDFDEDTLKNLPPVRLAIFWWTASSCTSNSRMLLRHSVRAM